MKFQAVGDGVSREGRVISGGDSGNSSTQAECSISNHSNSNQLWLVVVIQKSGRF
jgi:hypothetical protein